MEGRVEHSLNNTTVGGFSLTLFLNAFPTAAGKSTFVNILKQANEEWEVVPEPVARWCNVQQSSGDDCEVKEKKKVKRSSDFRIPVYPTDWVFFRLCVIGTLLLIAFTMSEFLFSSLLGYYGVHVIHHQM